MKYLGSNAKPVVHVSEKQVSELKPVSHVVETKEPKRGYNLYTAPALVLAQKLENKKNSARTKGQEFSIPLNTVALIELINKSGGKCGYTGQNFIDPNDVTFERIDPNIGYTVDNTIFVCLASNNQKSLLDAFEKEDRIPLDMKIKMLNKTIYRLTKKRKALQSK